MEPDLAAGLSQQLALLARRLARPVRLHGPSGWTVLDRPAYQALWRIVEEGPIRPTVLAGLLEVDLSVVSRQVKALETSGLVQRAVDPQDGRASLISVTEAGAEAFAATARQRAEVLQVVLGPWPEHDRRELVRMLERFNTELEAEIARRRSVDVEHVLGVDE